MLYPTNLAWVSNSENCAISLDSHALCLRLGRGSFLPLLCCIACLHVAPSCQTSDTLSSSLVALKPLPPSAK